MRRATVALLVAAVAAGGCSGHSPPRQRAGLSAADRVAYYQVATAIGAMRGRAALVATRRRGARNADAAVKAAIPKLRSLRPHDAGLVSLRRRTLALARRTSASPLSGAAARRDAAGQLADVTRLSSSLDALVRRDPRFSPLLPD